MLILTPLLCPNGRTYPDVLPPYVRLTGSNDLLRRLNPSTRLGGLFDCVPYNLIMKFSVFALAIAIASLGFTLPQADAFSSCGGSPLRPCYIKITGSVNTF